jgi:putative ABC transport system ATP-binding protein
MSAFFECGPFTATDGEGRVLFENVRLSLEDGHCVAIEGPSGGGKSTLLRCITGLAFSPAANRSLANTTYGGADLPGWRRRVTLAAQDAPMVPGTVRDNLQFPFDLRAGREVSFDEERAAALMTKVGLEQLPFDREVRTLSGGERHRLALIRGLLWDPPVLVTDEPFAGLDPDIASICFDLLLEFGGRRGHLLICVLHEPGLTARVDRRFRLVRGELRGLS